MLNKIKQRYSAEWIFYNVGTTWRDKTRYPQYIPASKWVKTEMRDGKHILKFSDLVSGALSDEATVCRISASFPYGNGDLPNFKMFVEYSLIGEPERQYLEMPFTIDTSLTTVQEFGAGEYPATATLEPYGKDINIERYDRKSWSEMYDIKYKFFIGTDIENTVPFAGVPEGDESLFWLSVDFLA
jgi:hypothetical protein